MQQQLPTPYIMTKPNSSPITQREGNEPHELIPPLIDALP